MLDLVEVNKVIDAYDLRKRDRNRRKIYNRMFLYTLLRKNNFTLKYIGEMFGLDHATVLHGLRQAENLKNDSVYLNTTNELRVHFQFDLLPQRTKDNLIKDVLNCESYWQMVQIQKDIKDGVYKFTLKKTK